MKFLVLSGAILLVTQTVMSQQERNKNERKSENSLHHRVSLIISSTHIREANELSEGKKTFYSPTIGANYELWLNNKWAVGLHNDIVVNSLKIENKGAASPDSKSATALTTIAGIYKPWKHWTFFGGPGKEFEKTGSNFVIKTGVEYGIELTKNWEIGFGFEYDTKINGYNSWLLGIGFSRNIFHS